jgi:protein JSN1
MGYPRNQFIFDGIVDNCLVIGQGRFGSRSIRTIIGSPLVTKQQQVNVALKLGES